MPDGVVAGTHHGPFPFVTHADVVRIDGRIAAWESRSHRKHHNGLDTGRGSTWWAPGAVAWWIGVLFALGATCFAIGPLPSYAAAVGSSADAWTYFIGSIFFTSAAFGQYLESVNADPPNAPGAHRRIRLVTFEPTRIDWCAAVVQFGGTVLFNISTFAALRPHGAAATDRLVWRPDVAGSICFLVASALAWAEAGGAWVSFRPRRLDWWIAAVNLAGSIAFALSAIGARVLLRSGEELDAALANAATCVGAVCFLLGAVALLPERTLTEPATAPPAGTPQSSAGR